MLGAFFILTDPVSGATTPRGKLIFAAGVALFTWIIRTFGAYPDGMAFAVLLMNICVPLIDMHTQPPVFGRKRDTDADENAMSEPGLPPPKTSPSPRRPSRRSCASRRAPP